MADPLIFQLNEIPPAANSGWFRIYGVTIKDGLPVSRQVRLFLKRTGQMIGQIWSAPDGSYAFNYIAYRENDYFVIAHDSGAAPKNAAIADFITPEPMP